MIWVGMVAAALGIALWLDERAVRKRNECIKRELERPEWWR